MSAVAPLMALETNQERQRPRSLVFLKLPLLVKDFIIKQLDPYEVFELSRLSKKMLNMVCFAKPCLNRLTWQISEDFCSIKLLNSEEVRFEIMVILHDISSSLQTTKLNGATVYVDSESRPECVNIIGMKYNGLERSHLFNVVSDYALKIFAPKEFECIISSITAAREFMRNDNVFAEVVVNDGQVLSIDDMDFLNELNTEYLILGQRPFAADSNYVKPLKPKQVYFRNNPGTPRWLSLASVLNMKTATCITEHAGFTIEDAKALVDEWCNGGLRQLEKLIMIENVNFQVMQGFIEEKQPQFERDGKILRVMVRNTLISLKVSES